MNQTSKEALEVKAGKRSADEFIGTHRKFILSCVSKHLHHYVTEQDDAYAIGLNAFHEAIRAYDETKGEFSSFASLVIKRRLYDEARKIKSETAVAPEMFEGKTPDDLTYSVGQQAANKVMEMSAYSHSINQKTDAIRDEIAEAQELLGKYGFSFFDLIDCSPKSKWTKEACRLAVVHLLRPGELYEQMKRTKKLPIKELTKVSGVHRKRLERHRKYIMAIAELLHGDFPHLGEYLTDIRKELEI